MVVYGRLGPFGSHQVVGVEAYSSVFLIASWVPKMGPTPPLGRIGQLRSEPESGQTAASRGSRPQRPNSGCKRIPPATHYERIHAQNQGLQSKAA